MGTVPTAITGAMTIVFLEVFGRGIRDYDETDRDTTTVMHGSRISIYSLVRIMRPSPLARAHRCCDPDSICAVYHCLALRLCSWIVGICA